MEKDETDNGDLELTTTIEKRAPIPKPRLKSLPQTSKIDNDKSTKKKNLKKHKKDIIQEEDGDDNSITKMIIPSNRSISDNQEIEQELSSDNPDDDVKDTNQKTILYSSLQSNIPTKPSDRHFLRTISYLQAQQSTPPCIRHQSHNTNDDSSHYSEITTGTNQSAVSNRSYSKVRTTDDSFHYDSNQQNDVVNMETEDGREEEEEEEEGASLLKTKLTTIPVMNSSNILDEEAEKKRIKRRKRLRFRWHLLYTILRNYHLFDLRKGVQSRLTLLRLQRSTLVDEQQWMPATTTIEEGLVLLFSVYISKIC